MVQARHVTMVPIENPITLAYQRGNLVTLLGFFLINEVIFAI
jgi:hypothetical protein